MSTNEGEVYFALDGEDFDPDQMTLFLGIEPTSILRKGERIQGKLPKHSSWKLSTEKITNDFIDVYAMTSSIVNILEPKMDLIIKAIQQFHVVPRLEVVLWFSDDETISTPAIGFEAKTIQFLAGIGAYVDIDTYFISVRRDL